MGKSQDVRSERASDRLYLLVPKDIGDEDIVVGRDHAGGGGLVGFIVRGGDTTLGEEPGLGSPVVARLREDLDLWTADGSLFAAEITVTSSAAAADDVASRGHGLAELLKTMRDSAAHRGHVPGLDGGLLAALDVPSDERRTRSFAVLLDALIESTRAQLILLDKLRSANVAAHREQVLLETPHGSLAYTLPFSRGDTYDSATVGRILSPTGKAHRSIAQHRRRANELLGVKVGNQYLHPKFQIDPVRHEIRPIVAYANRALECDADPWGALDWWYSKDEALERRRPVDMLDTGELSEGMD
jgi:hypothetical protein